jgi:two-component system chemotaxis response regulator CheY
MLNDSISIENLGILLIEPSAVQQKIIVSLLNKQGLQTLEVAGSAQQALEKMQTFIPDLLVSSLYLPDGDAPTLFAAMLEQPQLAGVAKMVVSSEQKKENLEAVRQAGVLALLPKPFDRTHLERALTTALDYLTHDEIELELYDVQRLRVLVVDDSRLARNHIKRVLQQLGVIRFDEAENGEQGIALLQQENYDLVVTDYNMPVLDGEALINHIRQSDTLSHIPVMLVTSEDESRLASVRQAGVSAICDKPFEISHVRQLLASLLDG